MLINLTNHPISRWNEEQMQKAEALYGSISDYSFPAVPVEYTAEDVAHLADKIVKEILDRRIEGTRFAVMCQGEFTLTYALVSRFQREGVEVISAVSERIVKEEKVGEEIRKTAIFKFGGFREYPR